MVKSHSRLDSAPSDLGKPVFACQGSPKKAEKFLLWGSAAVIGLLLTFVEGTEIFS